MKISTAYLISYNVAQVIGWSVVLAKTLHHVLTTADYASVYEMVTPWIHVFQSFAVLEVLHAVTGLVRSPVQTTVIQVSSRLIILWPVTYSAIECQRSVGVLTYVVAWSVTEVIRYSYYAAALLDHIPTALQWARYTFFIVLYPLGVTGELLTLYAAMPQIHRQVFPKMYFYMFNQRRKILGGKSKETQKKIN